jgi:hypothetical protein
MPVATPTIYFSLEQEYGATLIAAQASFALFAATAIPQSNGDPVLSAAVVGAAFGQGPLIGIWAVLGPGQRWRRVVESLLMFLVLVLCVGQGASWQNSKALDATLWQGAILVHAGSALTCAVILGMWRAMAKWRIGGPSRTPCRAQFSLRFVLLLIFAACVILAWMRVLPWGVLLDSWHENLALKATAMLLCGLLLTLPSIPFVMGAFRNEGCRDWFFSAYAIPIVCVMLFLGFLSVSTNSAFRSSALQPVMELFFGYTFFVLNVGATLISIRSFGYRWQPVTN